MSRTVADRRRASASVVAVAVAACILLPAAVNGQTESPSISVVATDTTAAPETTVTVAVRRPPALRDRPTDQGRFQLREDGEEREVEVVAPGDVQLEVWLLLDTSSGAQTLSAARSAAVELVLALPASARIGLVGYGGDMSTLEPTADRRAVTAALGVLEPGGQARLDRGVVAALEGRTAAPTVRPVVVAFGGGANAGRTEVTQRARAAELIDGTGVVFYALDAGAGAAAAPPAALAEQVGGVVLTADRPGGLTGLADRVVRDLGNTFGLRYRSQASPALVEVSYTDGDLTAVASRRLEPSGSAAAATPPAEAPALPLPGAPATTDTPAAQPGVSPYVVANILLASVAALVGLRFARQRWWGLWWRMPAALGTRQSQPVLAGATWAGSVAEQPQAEQPEAEQPEAEQAQAEQAQAEQPQAERDTAGAGAPTTVTAPVRQARARRAVPTAVPTVVRGAAARAATSGTVPEAVPASDSALDGPAELDPMWLDDDRQLASALADVGAEEPSRPGAPGGGIGTPELPAGTGGPRIEIRLGDPPHTGAMAPRRSGPRVIRLDEPSSAERPLADSRFDDLPEALDASPLAVLAGGVARRAWAPVGDIRPLATDLLVGQSVARVSASADEAVVEFAPSGVLLHSAGPVQRCWHAVPRGQSWGALRPAATFVLEVEGWTVVCTEARCELLARSSVPQRLASLPRVDR